MSNSFDHWKVFLKLCFLDFTSISLGCGVGEGDVGSELHHQVYNTQYFVIGTANEKLNGPIGVNQSTAKPVADLILLLSSDES